MLIIAYVSVGDRKKARAFTLVELLVVIAIIGVLAGLVMPVLISMKKKAHLAASENNVRSIVAAAQMYGDKHRCYPWPLDDGKAGSGELRSEEDARAALALLYRHGYLDTPEIFVPAGALERPAEPIADPGERRESFRLEEGQCSYTWRRKRITWADESLTPVTGDRVPEDVGKATRLGALVVGFKAGSVVSLDDELLFGDGSFKVRQAKAELIGWERLGGSGGAR